MKHLLVLILLSAASIASAAEGRALLVEGSQHTGSVGIKDGRCTVGRSGAIPLSDLVFVKFPAARIPREIDQGLILTNGDLIAGQVTIGEDRRVTLVSNALATRRIALEKVAVIILHKQPLFSLLRNLQAEEGVLLLNGERLIGTIKWVTPKKLGIDAVFGLMEVALENVAAIYYHPVKIESGPDHFRIRLKGGDRLSGTIAALNNEFIEIRHSLFESVRIQAGFVKELRPVISKAEHLSLIKENKLETTPYFDTVRPLRKNKNYDGQALSIGSESYDQGLIMMSRAAVTYTIRDGHTHLYLEAGIDESVGARGSIIIRVMLNGRQIHASPGPVTGADPALPLLLPLTETGELKIEIDFADNGSVADFAVLGDAMLLKKPE